jgi:hypothetical protein
VSSRPGGHTEDANSRRRHLKHSGGQQVDDAGATAPQWRGESNSLLAMQRLAGNRAVASAVAEGRHLASTSLLSLQRDPLPQYQSADQILELKPTVKAGKDIWLLSVSGDFSTPKALARLLWPTRDAAPPGVSIALTFTITAEGVTADGQRAGSAERSDYEIEGLAPWTLRSMDASLAARFTDLGLAPDSAALTKARATFRKKHDDLGAQALDNIDNALRRVTMGNPGLLVSYYDFYADWKLTDDIDADNTHAGSTDRTIRRGGFTDLNKGVLHLSKLDQIKTDDTLTLLGETLLHEYAHTAHASDTLKGPGEGKAYGVEAFLAVRFADKQRDKATTDLGERMGDKEAFNVTYYVLSRLYEVIDTHRSKLDSLKDITPKRAQEMATEFISKNRNDFSPELKAFIIAEFGGKGFNSLPSQE